MKRRGYAYSLSKLSRRSGFAEEDVLRILEGYREDGLAGLHEDGSGLWWLTRQPMLELWVRERVRDEERPPRVFHVAPCPECGEQTSAATDYFCAGCHFNGWYGRWAG